MFYGAGYVVEIQRQNIKLAANAIAEVASCLCPCKHPKEKTAIVLDTWGFKV